MIAKDTKTRGEAASVRNAAALVVSENVAKLIALNRMRNAEIRSKFNPITGEGSIGERKKIEIEDFPFPVQYVPLSMLKVPLVQQLLEAGSIRKFLEDYMNVEYSEEDKEKVIEQFVRLRAKHDFAFWAAMYVFIKQKGGGEDVHFRLNRPQRKLIMRFERRRLQGKPIRLILLKARQWGGSTATQIYMAWLQLVHKVGLNSLIVGHVKDASTEVKDMFDKLIKEYPVSMLYEMGEAYNETEPKIVGVGQSGNIHRIPQRNCKIKVGTARSRTLPEVATTTLYIVPRLVYG